MNHHSNLLRDALRRTGLIAILRGVRNTEVEAIGAALYDSGFRIIEVPLNSPEPLVSIAALRRSLPADCVVGAGTVLKAEQVEQVKAAGGELIVMPHSDGAVIRAARNAGLTCAPGVATVTEAFAALDAGADVLKMFPAEQLGPQVVKAWRAVVARDIPLLPVGGITPEGMSPFYAAGASGFGLGSALYTPGLSAEEVRQRAQAFMSAWNALNALANVTKAD